MKPRVQWRASHGDKPVQRSGVIERCGVKGTHDEDMRYIRCNGKLYVVHRKAIIKQSGVSHVE